MIKITGKLFGYWKVLSEPYRESKDLTVPATMVLAKCTACNKTKKPVRVQHLKGGSSKSCGCINTNKLIEYTKKNGPHNKVDVFTRESKIFYQQCKHSAKKRDIEFKLSLEEVSRIIQKPCIYCGDRAGNKRNTPKGEFRYNGIDRWDNSIGYIKSNTIPSCGRCNIMKSDIQDGSKFIEHIVKIINHHSIKIQLSEKKLDKYALRLNAIKQNSHDKETQVAAILINPKTGAVEAEGYNGFIRGAKDEELPNTRPHKYPYMVHAEANVVYNSVRSGVGTDNKILFCTLSPCVSCARMIWQCGIKTIYFIEKYRDFDEQCNNMLDLQFNLSKEGKYYKLELEPK